jgi:hypothetical protein
MTTKEMIELVQQHHPHLGETEVIKLLNRAKDTFCTETDVVKDSYYTSTVANQRYYILDSKILKIRDVWLNDIKIPMLDSKPIIDDDEGEIS